MEFFVAKLVKRQNPKTNGHRGLSAASCQDNFIIIVIIIIIIFIIITIIITELTHSKTILENTIEIESQPVALGFKNLSQYSSRFK